MLQEERLAKLVVKTGSVAIKRRKVTEEVDKRPLPERVSHEARIQELLRHLYGDRTFLDDVIREAGALFSFQFLRFIHFIFIHPKPKWFTFSGRG